MQSPTEQEKDWIDWCHGDQPVVYSGAAQDAVARMLEVSPYTQPIILAETRSGQAIARGYAVACQGAIGYLGRIRHQGDSPDPQALLAQTVSALCDQALEKGVELVQAISPTQGESAADRVLRNAFEIAGMLRAACLAQLECCDVPFRHDNSPLAVAFSPVELRPHSQLPWNRWCQLLEETYIDTLDVPILNGIRSIDQTLRGYAVGQSQSNLPWWSIHVAEEPIGCLILATLSDQACELTYLGLIPSARGHRYSPEIMDFVSDWMVHQGMSRIVLAVDEKNTPALHLYRSFGFDQIQTVEAWIASRSLAR
jgi:ribosomal protein S18 acetylase RimI-like enzyme